MARNHNFFFDKDGSPRARGPAAEKVLMTFLEVDVQGSDHICRDLMDDLTAIEDQSDDSREFIGNAHTVNITPEGVQIAKNDTEANSDANTQSYDQADAPPDTQSGAVSSQQSNQGATPAAGAYPTPSDPYTVPLKHFREVLEDWEAFILDDQIDDPMLDDDYL